MDLTDQKLLFDMPEEWKEVWQDMPDYGSSHDLFPNETITINFRTSGDRRAFAKLINQKITERTRSVWYPEKKREDLKSKNYQASKTLNPRFPVYIISKGRSDSRLTSKALEEMKVPYHIVIEKEEYDKYAAVIDPDKILVLPFSNLGQGSIPARNWVWEDSIERGASHHWILDDNIRGFYRHNNNLNYRVKVGNIFNATEHFALRYSNVALTGFNYDCLFPRILCKAPYLLNTRIYSCILINNEIPYRWRGRYNEDTDLSLRVLKDGWCTISMNAFTADKRTGTGNMMRGGNNDQLYQHDGRLKMAESLYEQHPDVTTISHKWDRYQHVVDYSQFKKNKLKLKDGIRISEEVNNFHMYLESEDE